jgi:hypothetical protein
MYKAKTVLAAGLALLGSSPVKARQAAPVSEAQHASAPKIPVCYQAGDPLPTYEEQSRIQAYNDAYYAKKYKRAFDFARKQLNQFGLRIGSIRTRVPDCYQDENGRFLPEADIGADIIGKEVQFRLTAGALDGLERSERNAIISHEVGHELYKSNSPNIINNPTIQHLKTLIPQNASSEQKSDYFADLYGAARTNVEVSIQSLLKMEMKNDVGINESDMHHASFLDRAKNLVQNEADIKRAGKSLKR